MQPFTSINGSGRCFYRSKITREIFYLLYCVDFHLSGAPSFPRPPNEIFASLRCYAFHRNHTYRWQLQRWCPQDEESNNCVALTTTGTTAATKFFPNNGLLQSSLIIVIIIRLHLTARLSLCFGAKLKHHHPIITQPPPPEKASKVSEWQFAVLIWSLLGIEIETKRNHLEISRFRIRIHNNCDLKFNNPWSNVIVIKWPRYNSNI